MTRRRRLLAALAPVGAALAAVVAYAAWASLGGGTPSVHAATMPTGSTPSATAAGRDVSVSWSQATLSNGVAAAGYVVHRYPAAGGSAVVVGSGCSGTVAALACTEAAVSPGSWKYTVTPVESSWTGTESAQSTAVAVGAPALSLSSVAVRPSHTVTANVSNFRDGESVSFHLGSASGTVIGGPVTVSSTSGSNGTATATLTVPAGTADGSYTVYAVASPSDDQATASLQVDGTAPTVSAAAVAPTSNTTTQGFIGAGRQYYVYANAADNTGGSGLAGVSANVSSITSGSTAVTLVAGSYPAFGTTYGWRSAALTASAGITGTPGYTVTASDNAGNTASRTGSVTVDNNAPSITGAAMAPVSNTTTQGWISAGGSYYVYATASDSPAGVASVTANVGNVSHGQTAVALVAGSYSAFGTTFNYRSAAITADSGISGTPTYTVSATDNAAGLAVSSASVHVDSTAPAVSAVAVAHVSNTTVAGTLAQGVSYYVYANASDSGGSGLAAVTADASGLTTGQTAVALTAGSYTAFGTTWGYRSAALTANASLSGSVTVSATATDNAANTGSGSTTVSIDNVAPTVTAVSSSNNDGAVAVGDTFSVTFSEAIDPGTVSTTAGASTLSFSLGNGQGAHVMVSISGLMASSDTGLGSGYVKPTKTVSYPGTLSLGNSNQTVTFTVTGGCTGTNCSSNVPSTAAGSGTLTYAPDASAVSPYKLDDNAGNAATGTKAYTATLF